MASPYRGMDDANFPPGTQWSYKQPNNGGFVLLTAAIERIAGMSIEDFLRTRILGPIGMNQTPLRCFDTDFVPIALRCT